MDSLPIMPPKEAPMEQEKNHLLQKGQVLKAS
jgi:hypothetical protein